MSVVLYALGAGLLAWSAYLILSGESYAAMDIAASLAGWGAFTIGLGALTAALHRLTRIVAATRTPEAGPEATPIAPQSSGRSVDVLPDFAPRRVEPARVEPPPAAGPLATDPERLFESDPRIEPEPVAATPAQQLDAAPAPAVRGRKERRAARLRVEEQAEPALEAPKVVASAPGGGFSGRAAQAEAGPRPAPDPEPQIDQPEDFRPEPAVAAGRPTLTRPIMPERSAGQPLGLEDPAPAVEPASKPAVEPFEPVAATDDAPAPDAAVEPAPDPAGPPEAPAAHAEAAPAAPKADARDDPKIPDWLARARARRQARLSDDDDPAPPAPRPRFVRDPAPEPETAAAVAPDAEPDPDPAPAVVREGEHNGVVYRFFDDGSVEAQSPHGIRRFGSVEELRAAVLGSRPENAADAEIHEPEHEGAPSPKREPEPVAFDPEPSGADGPEPLRAAPPDEDPLDAALAELEGRHPPEIRIDPGDRLGGGRS